MRNAASAVPVKVAQTVEIDFVMTVPTNVTVGVNVAVKIALQGIVNVNTMGAIRYTVITVVKTKTSVWNFVTPVMKRIALSADT